MREPVQVLSLLRDRFERDYPDWARGKGSWPLRVPLKPPSMEKRSADPVACHGWAARWAAYQGPGTVEQVKLKFPTGTHAMPKTLTLEQPREVAAATVATQETWSRCGNRLINLQRDFPGAHFSGLIRRITELDEQEYRRLFDAARWLTANPTSGLLLRALPIEGIDTKWLAGHAALVLALIGETSPSAAEPTNPGARASARRRLHERLGLRVPPELLQITMLDPALRAQLAGMRHLAASADDLSRWPRRPQIVIVLENKETGYAITGDHLEAVVLHGQGANVADYARISWLHTARTVIYWGDIDAPGLQFVSDLRGYGIPARSILMDLPTLERFRHLAVAGAGPQRDVLPHLDDAERELYRHLVEHATDHGTGLLLEQERIPWPHAHGVLTTTLRQAENGGHVDDASHKR